MEHEIHDHAKKAIKKGRETNTPLWEKVKHIAEEVAIIVFAVSISIWFHNMSETRHKRHDVKEFLLGLREDLTQDIKEMESDRASYHNQEAAFTYITSLKMNQAAEKDSLKKYGNQFGVITELIPNNGRFEGFKSSGKIGNIENIILQNDIMDLYQENIPSLLSTTSGYIERKNLLNLFLFKNRKRVTDSTTNFLELTTMDESRNICNSLNDVSQITGRYTICIDKMKKIIAQIDKEYGH
jgi:hypothetical protein